MGTVLIWAESLWPVVTSEHARHRWAHHSPCGYYAIGVYCSVRFIETPVFTTALRRLLTDERYRALQLALWLRPEQGALIAGGGGIRKVRWSAEGRGKRGGLRVIYYWAAGEDVCYMLYVYSKNEQEDMTREQLRILARLVREELK